MMKKCRLLLLDANVVIELFRLGIWNHIVERCDVHLARTVAETEAHFYVDDAGDRFDFDLLPYGKEGKIVIVDVSAHDVAVFCSQFGPLFLESLDPGEAESLAYLNSSPEPCLVCSADKIVYRVLGALCLAERGISLEEILAQTGLGRRLKQEFTRAYRERWTRKGFEEGLRGLGTKKEPRT